MNEWWTDGFEWTWRPRSLLRLLSDSLAVLLKKSLVLSYVLSDVFVLVFCCFFLHASSDFSSVSQRCHLIDPQGPMTTKKISKLLYSFTLSLASNHSLSFPLSLSLCYFSLGSLSLSQRPNDKIELWQLGQGCQFWLPRLLSLSLLPPFNLPFADLSPSLLTPPGPIFPLLCSVILSQLATNLILLSFLPSFDPPFFLSLPL